MTFAQSEFSWQNCATTELTADICCRRINCEVFLKSYIRKHELFDKAELLDGTRPPLPDSLAKNGI